MGDRIGPSSVACWRLTFTLEGCLRQGQNLTTAILWAAAILGSAASGAPDLLTL